MKKPLAVPFHEYGGKHERPAIADLLVPFPQAPHSIVSQFHQPLPGAQVLIIQQLFHLIIQGEASYFIAVDEVCLKDTAHGRQSGYLTLDSDLCMFNIQPHISPV